MQFSLLLYASILPYLSLILVFINWGGFGIDYTAIILPPCIFLINLALTRYNFLDIKNLARERVFEDNSLGFILLNRLMNIVDYNTKSIYLFKLFGLQLKAGNIIDLVKLDPELLNCIQNSHEDIFYRWIDQNDRYIKVGVIELKNKDEKIGQLVTLEDVTEREKLKNQLIDMANTDVLSGLNNRRRFREYSDDAYIRAKRYGESLSVLMMDIDFFKQINDKYGHTVGDRVIQAFAQLLNDNFRDSDIIGRMGGEEFAVVMIQSDEEKAFKKAELFRTQLVLNKINVDNLLIQVNVSIGLACINESILSLDELINRADHALYIAKDNGRNQTIVYK
jgi:diguanylate cyclase (GGDEF)-like protein